LPPETITLTFDGVAGQSFGLFCNKGMKLILRGEAQDYVGKGMHGGRIVVKPPATLARDSSSKTVRESWKNAIVGNTVLYGATGGTFFAAGVAGERLAVRNSGAQAVVEGCGDHGCEYMTGGVVVVLGEVGRNFGAGMSGGVAFVYDPDNNLYDPKDEQRMLVNIEMVGVEHVVDPDDVELLRRLIESHVEETNSVRGSELLKKWPAEAKRFWKIAPHPEQAKVHDEASIEKPPSFSASQLARLTAGS
jgi:glutamate synthase domain-containing protein 3